MVTTKALSKLTIIFLICVLVSSFIIIDNEPALADDVVNIDVPFIHQKDDPPDDPYPDGGWDGGHACGAASAVMITAYWGKLAPHPCSDCNSNDYSWYVNQQYTNCYGTTFSTTAYDPDPADPEDNAFRGAYGYIYHSGTVYVYVQNYLGYHGLVTAYVAMPSEAQIKAELDAGYPVYKHTIIGGGYGHEIIIKGYTDDATTQYIVNDPLYGTAGVRKTYLWDSIDTGYMITVHPNTDQTWFLSSDTSAGNRVMHRGDTSKTADTVTVTEGNTVYWISNEPSTGGVTFPAGLWNTAVDFSSAPASNNSFNGYWGTYDPDGPTYSWEEFWSFSPDGSKTYFNHGFNPGSVTVPDGDYIAFWIVNVDDASNEDLVANVGSSYSVVISPSSDPGYPIPEMSTIVLVSVGLAGLATYFVISKRRSGRREHPSRG